MAALPPSDVIKPLYKGGPQPSDQKLYGNNQNLVVAHRFYHDKKRGGRETAEMIAGIFASFTTECEAKGGYIENRDSGTFEKTFSSAQFRQLRFQKCASRILRSVCEPGIRRLAR